MWSKLRNIENKHIHFCYLKHCAGLSKINHILKTCKIKNFKTDYDVILENMDKEFQLEIKRLNVNLREDQVDQMKLSIKHTGLGLRTFKMFSKVEYTKSIIKIDTICNLILKRNKKFSKSILQECQNNINRINEFWFKKLGLNMLIHLNPEERLTKNTIKNKIWNQIDQKELQKLLFKVDKFDYAFLKSLEGSIFNSGLWSYLKKHKDLLIRSLGMAY